MSDSGSLGNIGLTGSLGRKTTANLIIYGSEFTGVALSGTQFQKICGTGQILNDNRHNDVMPYNGKFTEFRFLQQANWKGTVTIQKNNIDTAMTFTIVANNDNVIKKIKVDVPFVVGDLFRVKFVTTGTGSFRKTYILLFGGLEITN